MLSGPLYRSMRELVLSWNYPRDRLDKFRGRAETRSKPRPEQTELLRAFQRVDILPKKSTTKVQLGNGKISL